MKKTFIAGIILFLITIAGALAADSLSITGIPSQINANGGETVKTFFILNNNGNTTLNVTINSITLNYNNRQPFYATTIPTSILNFEAGQAKLINITSQVPALQYAGLYTGIVNASAGQASANFNFEILVNSNPSLTMNIGSFGSVIKGTSKSATISFVNIGNKDETAVISPANLYDASDPSKVLVASNIVFAQGSLNVKYGQTNSTQITINVPAGQANGTYVGNVSVTYSGKTVTKSITIQVTEPVTQISFSPSIIEITEDPNKPFSTTVTVTNTGTTTINDISAAFNGLTGFNLSNNAGIFSLTSGQSKSIVVSGNIPDSIDTKLNPFSGNFVLSNGAGFSNSVPLKINGEIMLKLENVDVYVGGTRDRVDIGDTISKEAKPGDTIRIKGELTNLFSGDKKKDEDIAIENIDFTLTVNEIDDGDDIEEEISVDDIDADETNSFEYEFVIPYGIDEDTYTINFEIEAEDENGANYYIYWDLNLEVVKNDNEIKLTLAELDSMGPFSCDRTIEINVEVTNIGNERERNVFLEAVSTSLKLSQKTETLTLSDDPSDDDNIYSTTFTYDIPSTVKPGAYSIKVNAYLSANNLDDTKTITVNVEECGANTNGENTDNNPDDVVIPPKKPVTLPEDVEVITGEDNPIIVQPPTIPPTNQETKFTDSTNYMFVLGGLFVVLLIIFIAVIVVLIVKK